ncbi:MULTISPECIES: ATP-binding protein [Paenibacillus]|uniref:HD domain-containing protein n=1 Tax=Paenibacillus albilobatus TaxID=2716884 RepID=A0A919XEB1_9BACL|nr:MULTISPECIES: ATP-binding protein [Paenibacillus]GIO29430.1 hypothetical protein J2TS6_05710 [Paenibacillus albilobatus]
MSTIHMLVGLPGSGKSHYAKELCKRQRAALVATDAIRERLFGSESIQKNAYLVFEEAYLEIGKALESGRNVVFDATNVSRDRRLKFLKTFKDAPVECHVMTTPYEVVAERNLSRKRRVGERILTKYAKSFEFPVAGEGFQELHLVHFPSGTGLERETLEQLLASGADHDTLFAYLSAYPHFRTMLGFDQENPHHSKTLSEHTYAVLEYLNACYEGEHLLAMQLAALFHDIGKPFSKVWKASRGYYSYYGHEHVSASVAAHVLQELGYDKGFALHVIHLVSFHMDILHGGDAGASKIYHLLGEDVLAELYFFAEADTFAK